MPWRATGRKPWGPAATTTTPSRSSSRGCWPRSRPCWTGRTRPRAPRRPGARREAAPGREGEMAKILLVEDNQDSREALARRLKRRGYEVVMAVDGQQGLDMARSAAPDLVLMDMNLPVLDGWEATRRLKADAQTRSIPVIALTAHALESDRTRT